MNNIFSCSVFSSLTQALIVLHIFYVFTYNLYTFPLYLMHLSQWVLLHTVVYHYMVVMWLVDYVSKYWVGRWQTFETGICPVSFCGFWAEHWRVWNIFLFPCDPSCKFRKQLIHWINGETILNVHFKYN